jgi:hypothetical protein
MTVPNSTPHPDAARGLRQVVTLPPPRPGFIGEGHTAIHAINAREFAHNDPFIMSRWVAPRFELELSVPATKVRLTAGAIGARLMLYAGERQHVPILTHGPFVGETREDLVRMSDAYAQGRMPRVSELP